MRYYPISIDTRDKKVLVIGGGRGAYLKVRGLLKSEFLIYCLSTEFTESLQKLAEENKDRIFLKEMEIDEDFRFFAYDYLILATDDVTLNHRLAKRAKISSVPVLSLSKSDESDFHLLANTYKGPLTVSIQTSNPSLSRFIKRDVEKMVDGYSEEKLKIMNNVRRRLVEEKSSYISELMEELWEKEEISNEFWEDRFEDSHRNEKKPAGYDPGEECCRDS